MNKRTRKAHAKEWTRALLTTCERYIAGTYSLPYFYAETGRIWAAVDAAGLHPYVRRMIAANLSLTAWVQS